MKVFEKNKPFSMASRWLLLIAGLATVGCSQKDPVDAVYQLDSCHRLSIYDAVTGERINGAEDFAVDRSSSRLIISAYNRRAAEKAARSRAFAVPQGGIYTVSIASLLETNKRALSLQPLISTEEISGGLRPHGVSFDAQAGEIVFINRSYQKIDGKWLMEPRVERIGAKGEVFVGNSIEAPCAANDLQVQNGRLLTSFDHGDCGWKAAVEDMFFLKRSGLSSGDKVVFDKANYANGLAKTLNENVVVAATREKSLLLLDNVAVDGVAADKFELQKRISLPGGPDNLMVGADGKIVAAVHPNLLKLAVHRKMGIGRAGSRIVKVDPESGDVNILFDDNANPMFNAATVALEWGNALIAGSATDDGLLICKKS